MPQSSQVYVPVKSELDPACFIGMPVSAPACFSVILLLYPAIRCVVDLKKSTRQYLSYGDSTCHQVFLTLTNIAKQKQVSQAEQDTSSSIRQYQVVFLLQNLLSIKIYNNLLQVNLTTMSGTNFLTQKEVHLFLGHPVRINN